MQHTTPLCFVDIETTGLSASRNRIIEIGVLKVIEGEVTEEYKTLLNPQTRLDPFIENMTGIKTQDLIDAPYFEDIQEELRRILDGSIFVAHNVRFDYGFIRQEFKRAGSSYTSKHFCTVKLAKTLYPNLRRYNLDSIIENFNIECANRHRAFDDAKVIWEFYKKSKDSLEPKLFESAVDLALKRPSLPISIPPEVFEDLPETSGVYIFYGEDGTILYIGKSVNIRDRVLSHFSNDHLSATDMKISKEVKSIEYIETAGELGALMLESNMIKKHQPLFNRMLRYARKVPVLLKSINAKGYSTVSFAELNGVDISQIDNVLGVFRSEKMVKDYLYKVAKEYSLCPKILGLEKGKGSCFYYHLGQCSGACLGKESVLKYNLRFDDGFYNKKIRPWRFDNAIVIKEDGDLQEAHVVDKWCYLGSIKHESESFDNLSAEYVFDYDTYKILNRFIMDPKNESKISLLKNLQN